MASFHTVSLALGIIAGGRPCMRLALHQYGRRLGAKVKFVDFLDAVDADGDGEVWPEANVKLREGGMGRLLEVSARVGVAHGARCNTLCSTDELGCVEPLSIGLIRGSNG